MIRPAGLVLTLTLVAGCGFSEEDAITDRMSAIAESLSVPANDSELGRVARVASLSKAFAPDVRVTTGVAPRPGAQVPPEIVGRESLLALAGRWIPPPGGLVVEFVDVQVTLDDGGANASVYCTARMTSGEEQPIVDARELTVGFSKVDGEWLVTSVRPEDTLSR
jgi:hypothetical protein